MVDKIAAKFNIERRRAEIIFTALVVLVLAICAIPATYAMFEAGTDIDVSVSFGQANTTFEYALSGEHLRNPGDTQDVTLKVKSTGDIPMRYYFTVERNTEASRLAAYLAMYWDGEYMGMLSELTTGQLGTFDEGASIPTYEPEGAGVSEGGIMFDNNRYFLIPGDTQEHTLSFEYHIGASAIDAASARNAEIKVRGYAETIDLENETVVYNDYDFEQAILLSNYGKLTQNRVVLGGNITLSKDLTLDGVNASTGALHIDVNGKTLNLGGHSLTVADGTSGSGILILHDSCGGGVINGGSIALRGSNAYIAGPGIADYSGSFGVASYTPSAEVQNIIGRYARAQAVKAVKGGVQSGDTNSFIKGYGAYGSKLAV
ncbi:MAG: hypothetical protein J5622_00680, partial [Firmicutes bacterium]|nr:hypothetical protein [Bacillota bacterium]